MAILLTDKEVATLMGISSRHVHRLRQTDPNFPKAISLGARCVRWKLAEVTAYVEAL
ncbi:AlpA family phage regulatory protein [Sphingobium sp. PNB]|uniref:helix-turn-helix transcriptional regulator n=1 Tax=Sphingobium sp. PNB TaxID=863934 RepID=UPI001CA3B710|nr:AlpA family phage regulatory protein [Sphingobium sp. PNB]MCB4862551.1 AlpA family phage regulatory protein [Sphingobium sp. PNB]